MREKFKTLKDRFKDKASNLFHKLNSIQKDYYTKTLPKACKDVFTLGSSKSYPMTLNFNKGFCVGLYKGLNSLKPTYYDAPLSTLIIAPPGSGKTAAVAVPNLLNVPSSCVVLDIKGELFNLTAGYRQQVLKNKIFVFDPLGNDNTLKFNPFDKRIVEKLDFNRKRRLVDEVGNTIFAEDGANKDPHWTQQAKNLFVFYALYDLCVHNTSTFFEIASAPIKNYVPLINPQSRFYTELYECQSSDNGFIKENGRYIPNKFHALNNGYHAIVQKRKAYELLKPLQHHGANKTMTKNLILLEKEIKEHNNDTKNALGIVYSYLSYSQLALNDKTNSFALNRHLKYLNNIALIVSDTLRAEVNETNHSCIEFLKNLAQRENETMELLEKRKNFCIERKERL